MREHLKSGRHKERMERQKLAKKNVPSFFKPRTSTCDLASSFAADV